MESRKTKRKASAKIRILLVDDHVLMRRGLKTLIETEPDLVVCAEAATRLTGLDAITASNPDLVIIDLSLRNGDCDGLELIKDIKKHFPHLHMLVLTMHEEATYAERALRAGARGYVTKQELDGTVITAIRHVLAGEIHTSEAMSRRLTQKFVTGGKVGTGSEMDVLSDRELEVFKRIGTGQTTRKIADELFLSVKTIESYREHLKVKLGLASGVELIRQATLWVETGHMG